MSSVNAMIGQKFGRLTVISRAPCHPNNSNPRWLCMCECGKTAICVAHSLRIGASASCGCKQRDAVAARNRTHGGSRTAEYRIWKAMHTRCTNPKSHCYHRYGGRGITICERWVISFENFLADMGPRPSPKHSIDRINNDGNYEPANCRWATPAQQRRSASNTILIAFAGKTMPLKDWADELGLPYQTLKMRIHRGWSSEKALTTQCIVRIRPTN